MNYNDFAMEAATYFNGQASVGEGSALKKEYAAAAAELSDKVGKFLSSSGISAVAYEPGVSMEAINDVSAAVSRYGVSKIAEFLETGLHIGKDHLQQATLSVLNVLSRHDRTQSKGAAWAGQLSKPSKNTGIQYAAYESIYSDTVAQSMSTSAPSFEAFGVDINVTSADLKTALVLTLLQYYIGLIPRVLPTIPANQPSVVFTKQRRKVMDLAENPDVKYNFIELMRNPNLIWGELKKIVPLVANASNGEVTATLGNGVLIPSKEVNILQLSVDETQYGHAKINITDVVADNISLDNIYITLSDGTATETFKCPITTTYARLTRSNNSKDAADRQAIFNTSVAIMKGATNMAGTASAILAGVDDGEGFRINFFVTSILNLKTGKGRTSVEVAVAAYGVGGTATPSTDLATALAAVNGAVAKPASVGYTLDARFEESNFRKASKLATIDKQQISYELMQGTNYFVQVALEDKQQEDATVDLGQLIQLEQDASQLRSIEGVINKVDMALRHSGMLNQVDDIGAEYVAGDIVFPATYSTTLDVAKLKVLQTGDIQGDVRTRVRTFLGYVTTELVRLSLIDKVLTNGAEINFGLITNRRVLDNCLSVKHYHNHLNGGDTNGTRDSIEFRLVLDNGIILNVVTTTFEGLYGDTYSDGSAANKNVDKMILFPIMPNSPDSYLNLGQIYDYGAMSGRYSFTDRGSSVERIFANVRRQFIPTNPQGAIIDIVGIEEIMVNAVYAKALTAETTGTVNF